MQITSLCLSLSHSISLSHTHSLSPTLSLDKKFLSRKLLKEISTVFGVLESGQTVMSYEQRQKRQIFKIFAKKLPVLSFKIAYSKKISGITVNYIKNAKEGALKQALTRSIKKVIPFETLSFQIYKNLNPVRVGAELFLAIKIGENAAILYIKMKPNK